MIFFNVLYTCNLPHTSYFVIFGNKKSKRERKKHCEYSYLQVL